MFELCTPKAAQFMSNEGKHIEHDFIENQSANIERWLIPPTQSLNILLKYNFATICKHFTTSASTNPPEDSVCADWKGMNEIIKVQMQ